MRQASLLLAAAALAACWAAAADARALQQDAAAQAEAQAIAQSLGSGDAQVMRATGPLSGPCHCQLRQPQPRPRGCVHHSACQPLLAHPYRPAAPNLASVARRPPRRLLPHLKPKATPQPPARYGPKRSIKDRVALYWGLQLVGCGACRRRAFVYPSSHMCVGAPVPLDRPSHPSIGACAVGGRRRRPGQRVGAGDRPGSAKE
jgi:hypothetical protein